MQTSATNKRLRQLLVGIRDKTLVPNPHFQRRLVWSNVHKVAFLRTVLEGLPFPEIFISAGEVNPDTGDGTELIVDGQQRITTLYQYFVGSGDLQLKGANLQPYFDLDPVEKVAFLEYEVVVRDLGPISEEETRDIFHRINSTNYSLNAMEVNNSRFDGRLKRFAEEIAENSFFQEHKVFTGLDGRRMNDIRFALTLIITMMSGYFNRDDEHEGYLEHYNDDLPDEGNLRGRIANVIDFLERGNFASKSRVWQKADLLAVLVELDRLINIEHAAVDPGVVRDCLEEFYGDVEEVPRVESPVSDAAEYYRRVRSGINDRVSRINRGEAIRGRLVVAGRNGRGGEG
jgi:Protein of unknown function DUF262